MSLDASGYHGLVLKKLSASGIAVGDRVTIISSGKEYAGIVMPRSQVGSDAEHIVIKLDNGYNIGVRIEASSEMKKEKTPKKKRAPAIKPPIPRDDLATVSILSTGGTIASRVDYRTGAVNPALTAQDLYDSVPELKDHANIYAKIVMSVLSENIGPKEWTEIARSVASEIRKEVDGVVVAHGTDTMGYTAAALSFALQNIPIPVVLVGSQRSSDRPSSDAALNLIGAVDFAAHADAAEVMGVMHAETDDSYVIAHRGTRMRKFHTSRRDAFQSVNSPPMFKISSGIIHQITEPLLKRDKTRKLQVKAKFNEKVALVKTYSGIHSGLIDYLVDQDYRGIVIEGTGLGHTPEYLHSSIERALDADVVVAMTSQCVSGRVDMNVYRSGVELLDIGVVPCEDMIAETALVKLMWLLANSKTTEQVRRKMPISLVGEIDMRSEQSDYSTQKETS